MVAEAPGLLVFCEVKTRRGVGYGTPAAAVDAAKQAQLRRLAGAYLRTTPHRPSRVRFDVVTVVWPRQGQPRVEHLEECCEDAGPAGHGRAGRPHRVPGRGRGRHRPRPARRDRGRARRHRRPGGARPAPGRVRQHRLRVAGPAHHRLPAPGRPAQAGLRVRPADRDRAAGRGRVGAAAGPRGSVGHRRARPRRRRPRGQGRAARRPGGPPVERPAPGRTAGQPGRGRPRPRPAGRRRRLAGAGRRVAGRPGRSGPPRAAARPRGAGGRGPRRHPRPAPGPPGLEIAAAGAHNLLLTGPPGAGKTMLARRLPGLLPPLEQDEALEVTQVFSAAGLLGPDAGLIRARPFRAPHHAISVPGLVGGGQVPDPARSPSPTAACCSSTSCRSSPGRPARRCANRSKRARSRSREP